MLYLFIFNADVGLQIAYFYDIWIHYAFVSLKMKKVRLVHNLCHAYFLLFSTILKFLSIMNKYHNFIEFSKIYSSI